METCPLHEAVLNRVLTEIFVIVDGCYFIRMQANRRLCGIGAVLNYSAHIFLVAGIPSFQIPYLVVGNCATGVVANLMAIPLIDKIGRRQLLIVTMSILVGDIVLLVVMMSIQQTYHWAAYVSIVCLYAYILVVNCGIGPIGWILGAELFEQRARPMAGYAAGIINYSSTFLVLMAFEPLDDTIRQYVYLFFAGFVLGGLIFTIVLDPETKKRTFREIARQMAHRRVSYVAP